MFFAFALSAKIESRPDCQADGHRDRHSRLHASDPPPDPERLLAETRERIGGWNEVGRRLCRSFLTAAERLAGHVA